MRTTDFMCAAPWTHIAPQQKQGHGFAAPHVVQSTCLNISLRLHSKRKAQRQTLKAKQRTCNVLYFDSVAAHNAYVSHLAAGLAYHPNTHTHTTATRQSKASTAELAVHDKVAAFIFAWFVGPALYTVG